MNDDLIRLAYVASAILFILCLKGLTHPRSAVRGNQLGALGMLIAVVATLFLKGLLSPLMIVLGIGIGGAIGGILAVRIQMTAMPQLVAIFNGFGGGASAFVAGAAVVNANDPAYTGEAGTSFWVATFLSCVIGAVTFTGSIIAFAKLQELMRKDVRFAGQQLVKIGLVVAVLAFGWWLAKGDPESALTVFWLLVALSGFLGIMVVVPIGGADMPVVIALLNSYSGLAAAASGFVVNNTVLIIAGSLVGASGLILTNIMCKAMNRSLGNVLFGTLEPAADGPSADDVYAGKVKASSPEEVAMLLETARKVVIVPGYGMAVAQCQHNVRDLANLLEAKGTEVDFAIHPVAGRMPGHMNVLLAEADIPYEKLKEMDEINTAFEQTDVTIVLGANDVVNPVARTDPNSAIAGMPILDVDKSRTVVVIKRSLSPGFAGIPNPLFAADNAVMLFGDGKKAMVDLVAAVKEG